MMRRRGSVVERRGETTNCSGGAILVVLKLLLDRWKGGEAMPLICSSSVARHITTGRADGAHSESRHWVGRPPPAPIELAKM
jgi:hypothetical protein